MIKARSAGVLALAASALAGCGGVRVAEPRVDPGLAWPAGQPRVRLERVLALQRAPGTLGGLLGRREDEPAFDGPFGVTWDGDAVVVSEPALGRVTRIDTHGNLTHSSGESLGHPQYLATCAAGITVSDSERGRIGLLGHDLALLRWLAQDLTRPTGLACDGDRVLVAETGRHRILVLEPDGTRREVGGRGTEHGRFNFPSALAVSGDSLFVGDTMNFRIEELDARTLEFRGSFGRLGDAPGDMPRVKGIAVDSAGQVWVSDAYLDRVSLFSATGELLLVLGRTGDGQGQFAFPAGIAATGDGRVAVVESLNRRVQVFRLVAPGTP